MHIAFSSSTDMVDLSLYSEINICDRTRKQYKEVEVKLKAGMSMYFIMENQASKIVNSDFLSHGIFFYYSVIGNTIFII